MATKRLSVGTGGAFGPPVEDLLKRAAASEAQGFDSIWWADHLMGWVPQSLWTPDISEVAKYSRSPNVFFDPVAAIATAATATSRVKLGVCVTDAIRRHPAMLANEFLTLHHMTHGRTVLGLGAGEGENIVPYGMDFTSPVSKLEEALRVIRLLWESTGPVDFRGEHFTLADAVLGLEPFQGSLPEIWIGANGRRMCSVAGALADGWVPVMMPVEQYATRLGWIRESARANGRDGESFTAAMFSFLALGDDHEAVHELMKHPFVKGLCLSLPAWCYESLGVEHPMGAGFHGLTSYIPSRIDRETALRLIDRIPFEVVHEYMLHGTPDDVVDAVRTYVECGLSHLILQNVGFMGDLKTAGRSFRLLSELVQDLDRRVNH